MTKKNNSENTAPQKKGVTSQKNNAVVVEEAPHRGANHLSSGAKHSMKTRIISAIVMLIIVIPALFLGDWIYFGLMTIALGIACWEILGCAKKRLPIIFIVYFLFVTLITYWPIFKSMLTGLQAYRIDSYFDSIYLSIIVIVVGFFLLFGLTVIYKDFSVVDACFLIAMGILIGFGFQCLFFLRYYPVKLFGITDPTMYFTLHNTIRPSLLILFVIVCTFATDTGAYFVGVFFGKNKMNERISPKKTWEGFVGGIIISFLVTSGIAFIFAACGNPIIPLLDIQHWYFILILAVLIPLFATLGDFVFSSIKRYWGIKDYGKIMPGHGGVLDRLDSIFFASIIAAIFVFILGTINAEGDIDWVKLLV